MFTQSQSIPTMAPASPVGPIINFARDMANYTAGQATGLAGSMGGLAFAYVAAITASALVLVGTASAPVLQVEHQAKSLAVQTATSVEQTASGTTRGELRFVENVTGEELGNVRSLAHQTIADATGLLRWLGLREFANSVSQATTQMADLWLSRAKADVHDIHGSVNDRVDTTRSAAQRQVDSAERQVNSTATGAENSAGRASQTTRGIASHEANKAIGEIPSSTPSVSVHKSASAGGQHAQVDLDVPSQPVPQTSSNLCGLLCR